MNDMSDEKRRIKVLWIDDDPSEFSEFRDDAYDAGLDIEVCKTVLQGLDELEDRNKIYEAIILDANCKIADEKEAQQLAALSHAIAGIYVRGIDLPWFVYTGGAYEGKEALEHIIPQQYRSWDNNQWYNKPDQEHELFEAIKNAVKNRETTRIKDAYPEAFRFSSSQVLLDILKDMNTKDFERDVTVPNKIRTIVEQDICSFLRDNGIYPAEYDKKFNKIKQCSYFFGSDNNHEKVPAYIQRLFHFLSEYANEGSHGVDKREIAIARKQKSDIEQGLAKHLNRAGVDALLSICLWCSTFPVDDPEKMKPYHEFFLNLKTKFDRK